MILSEALVADFLASMFESPRSVSTSWTGHDRASMTLKDCGIESIKLEAEDEVLKRGLATTISLNPHSFPSLYILPASTSLSLKDDRANSFSASVPTACTN